jgi:hypothetical protein
MEPPVFATQALLNRWKDMLPASELETLRNLKDMNFAGSSSFLVQWSMAETELLSVLAAERKRRFKERFFNAAPERPEKTSRTVKAFFDMDNPLDREKFLDKIRWDRAISLSASDPMGFNGLLSYFIRTSILEKYVALSTDSGRARLDGAAKAAGATTTFEHLK